MPRVHHGTLASNGVAHVQQCTECGHVSIHLSRTTMPVDACALENLWAVLEQAAATRCAQPSADLGYLQGLA